MPRRTHALPPVLSPADSVRALAELMLMFLDSLNDDERARLERRLQSESAFDAAMASHLQAVHDAAASCLAGEPEARATRWDRLLTTLAGSDDDLRRMALFGLSEYAPAMFEVARADPETAARARRRASELLGAVARH